MRTAVAARTEPVDRILAVVDAPGEPGFPWPRSSRWRRQLTGAAAHDRPQGLRTPAR
jgi:hypothetical protein